MSWSFERVSRAAANGSRGPAPETLLHPRAARQQSTDGSASDSDVHGLVEALRASVEGEVRFDSGSRALYSMDASNYRQVPIGVVLPRHPEDVLCTLRAARRFGVPVLSRGGGTSLAGQSCNRGVVMDFSKYMNGLLALDPEGRRARVQPGIVLDKLRQAAERHHLTFGPDPSTHNHCTLGGMLGNNSCGVHSVMAGDTSENVESLDVVTYDGVRLRVGPTSDEEFERIMAQGGRPADIYRRLRRLRDRYRDEIRTRYPHIARRVSGYNLPALLPDQGFNVAKALVGSESTCVTILEATLRLIPSPPGRVMLVLGYPDVYLAADHVPDILACKPVGLEGMDQRLVRDMVKRRIHEDYVARLPEGRGWLLAEFGGENAEVAEACARRCMAALGAVEHPPTMHLFMDPSDQESIWSLRKAGLAATSHVPGEPETWPGWEDSSVPVDRLGTYLRELRTLLDRYRYDGALYGHFGQGCVHTRITFDLKSEAGLQHYRGFLDDAADLVVRLGGSFSGEHGDGQARGELLPRMFGRELVQAFEEFKTIWDPDWKMNPGKVVRPFRFDEHLRVDRDYRPPQLDTYFQFPQDAGNFAQSTLRCVGIGECRREHGKTMCPSYRATGEEMHSTRGRARLLFEMLEGAPLTGGWRDPHVKESLDLCLSCKGCKEDCPVKVDMATYKAEFLAHYYEGRLRPMAAYSMGLIHWWARLASWMPALANLVTQTPLVSTLVKAAGGIAADRPMPHFASEPFTAWYRRRGTAPAAGREVLLWPDTFNNFFLPDTAKAACEVLESAGWKVVLPRRLWCCGRPLYDFGMLSLAKRQLSGILEELTDIIEAGTPIVVLEPSCAAVFRDELLELFPQDHRAKRLSELTLTFAEFADRHLDDFPFPPLRRRVFVHGHCHQKAVMGLDPDRRLLDRLQVELDAPDTGCCGMAGSFGFKREHYDVSLRIGELALLPAVRTADPATVILADGFSCRQQIEHQTPRQGLHLAEITHLAMQEAAAGDGGALAHYPECAYRERNRQESESGRGSGLAWLAVGVIAVGIALLWANRRTGSPRN